MNKLNKKENYTNQTFEDIKHIAENGIEYWYARELQLVLDYKEWRKFENVIKKAIDACNNSGISAFEHFVGTDKLSKRANNAEVLISDYRLTRYACYLIAQNGDSRKGLRYREDILDNMGSEELAANLFRITQTESRLKKDKINSEKKACDTHNKIGKIIRNAIKQTGRNNARRVTNTWKKFKTIGERK